MESIPRHLQRKYVESGVVVKVLVARNNCGHVVLRKVKQLAKESRSCMVGSMIPWRVGQEECCMMCSGP